MGAYIREDDEVQADIAKVFAIFPRLKERALQLAGTMSGGEQQMLAMGRALMARPKVLLLDEPSMGLSPIMVDKIFEVVADIHRRGTTVLLVEQNASRALAAPGPRRAGVAALSAGGGCQQRANGWLISGAMRGAIHARGTVQIGPPRPW